MRTNVIKKVSLKSVATWGDTNRPAIAFLKVDHAAHTVALFPVVGPDPLWESVYDLLLSDKDVKMELGWGKRFKRRDPAFICEYTGSSLCSDVSLYTSHFPEWVAKADRKNMTLRANIHISCYGKTAGFQEIFSADLSDLLTYFKNEGYFAPDHEIKGESFRYIKGVPCWDNRSYKWTTVYDGKEEGTE